MFDVAFANCVIYCHVLSSSPCTILCYEADVTTIGLQSTNLDKNCTQSVLKESMEFLGKE